MNYQEMMLANLRHKWGIDSIKSHVVGYWNFEGDKFDLRNLKLGNKSRKVKSQIFLDFVDEQARISIGGESSYYLVDRLLKKKLTLITFIKMEPKGTEIVNWQRSNCGGNKRRT